MELATIIAWAIFGTIMVLVELSRTAQQRRQLEYQKRWRPQRIIPLPIDVSWLKTKLQADIGMVERVQCDTEGAIKKSARCG